MSGLKINIKIVLSLLLTIGLLESISQNRQIDSLVSLLKKPSCKEGSNNCLPDTIRLDILNSLTWEFIALGDYQKALQYAGDAKNLARSKSGMRKGEAESYHNTGSVYYYQGNYPEAIKNFFAALKIREELGDKPGIASTYNNIGGIYQGEGNYREALKNHFASLKIKKEMGDEQGMAYSYNNIGLVYMEQGNYSEALKNHNAALKIREVTKNKRGVADSYSNIGFVYDYQGNYPEALKNYLAGLEIREETGDKQGIAESYHSVGTLYAKMNKASQGRSWLEKALALAKKIGSNDLIKESYYSFARADSALGNYKQAFENYKMYVVYRDSIFNEENTTKLVQSKMNYEFEKKIHADKLEQEKLNAIAEKERQQQRLIIFSVAGVLVIVLIFSFLLYRRFKLTNRQKLTIEAKNKVIEEKNKDILDSIRYAKRIQTSLLPTDKFIDRILIKKDKRV